MMNEIKEIEEFIHELFSDLIQKGSFLKNRNKSISVNELSHQFVETFFNIFSESNVEAIDSLRQALKHEEDSFGKLSQDVELLKNPTTSKIFELKRKNKTLTEEVIQLEKELDELITRQETNSKETSAEKTKNEKQILSICKIIPLFQQKKIELSKSNLAFKHMMKKQLSEIKTLFIHQTRKIKDCSLGFIGSTNSVNNLKFSRKLENIRKKTGTMRKHQAKLKAEVEKRMIQLSEIDPAVPDIPAVEVYKRKGELKRFIDDGLDKHAEMLFDEISEKANLTKRASFKVSVFHLVRESYKLQIKAKQKENETFLENLLQREQLVREEFQKQREKLATIRRGTILEEFDIAAELEQSKHLWEKYHRNFESTLTQITEA